MKIPLNNGYRLASDKRQWMVQRFDGLRTDAERRGEEIWTSLSFHRTASHAVSHHAETLVRLSDAETLDQAIKDVKKITDELTKALQAPEFEVHVK